jgi:P4 family phage/plasmid primase-like protien
MSNAKTVRDAAENYVNALLSVIPIRPDGTKAPALNGWKEFQSRLASQDEINGWFKNGNGLAIVCGSVSGNLELLDFDAPELYEPFCKLVSSFAPGLIDRLPLSLSPSGGYHHFYRCGTIEGNQKLAVRQDVDAEGRQRDKTLIETRGEGGYIIAPPSPATCHPAGKPYELLRGELTAIPEITLEERDILLNCARSFNEKVIQKAETEEVKPGNASGTRPGDDFNAKFGVQDWGELLTRHGWKRKSRYGQTEYWQRPSKSGRGISATVNYRGSNLLYVFSSNAFPFEPESAYTPFAAYTFLEHGGDFTAAAKALAEEGYGEKSYALVSVGGKLRTRFGVPPELREAEGQLPESVITALQQSRLSDAGNAECMVALYGDVIRYDHTREKWLVWDGVRWSIDDEGIAQRAAVAMTRLRQRVATELEDLETRRRLTLWGLSSENIQRVNAAIKMAQFYEPFSTTINRYDNDPLLATTMNGTLDLRGGSFRKSHPYDYLTMQLGCEFSPEAKAPRWEKFLREVFGGDEQLIEYIQRAVGYSLTGDTSEQVLFLCYGSGANGKSVFLEVVRQLLGDYAGAASFDTFDAGNRNSASNDLAALKGKRLVTVIETEEDRRLAEAKVKMVTGQDEITCRFLFKEFFTYRPQFKLWMAMNHKPVIRGTDRGIWRRIRLIPFTQSFEGREDRGLIGKLTNELPGILNWALEGLRKWQESGLSVPKAVKEATEEYRRESDSIGQWLDERTARNIVSKLRASEAYRNYYEWALERGERPFNQKNWGQTLIEKGHNRDRDREGMFYMGLALAP